MGKTDEGRGVEPGQVSDARAAGRTPAEKRVVDRADVQEVTVPAGERAMKFVDGKLVEVLGPGKHAAWTIAAEVRFAGSEHAVFVDTTTGSVIAAVQPAHVYLAGL